MPTSSSDHDREVVEQQRRTAATSASIARASRRASRDLRDDAMRILDTYAAKGGFDSREEALEYLQGYIEPKDRAVLIEAARRLPEPQRTRQLTRLSSSAYNWRMTRAQAVDKVQKMTSTRLRLEIEDVVKPTLDRTVTDSVKRANYAVQKQVGLAYSFDMPNERGIDQVVRGTGVYDKVRLFSDEEMKGVKEIITQGMLSGRKADAISKQVSDLTGKELYKARRLVRTTIAQASVDAKVKEYRELGIDEYEIVCTLDERTCPICSRYDGKKYKMGEGPMPTFHPNCRCGISQVLPDAVKGSMKRAARGLDGKSITVPADMTYDEWNARYGAPKKQAKLPDKDSSLVKAAVRKPEPVKLEDYSPKFSATKKEKRNTEILIGKINAAEGANPDVVRMYSMIGRTENFESNGIDFKITHTKGHQVGYSYTRSGELVSAKLVVPDLTKSDDAGAVATTLHEQMHLLDFQGRRDAKKVNGWFSDNEAYTKAVDEAGAEIGDEIKALFAERKASYQRKKKELSDQANEKSRTVFERYKNHEIDFKEYRKQAKAIDKAYADDLDRFARNDLGGGVDCLEDIYDALSRGRYRGHEVLYGHGPSYYSRAQTREREILANYGALSVLRPDLIEMLRRDKPGLVKALEELVSSFIDRMW